MSQAFSGVRIIDFTQVLAGPFATAQLALLGADVIKVEARRTGDQTRGLTHDRADTAAGMEPSFLTCNLGKRSITLDLKSPRAADIVKRLVASADVVVENFRPGVMDGLGIGHDALRSVREDLIFCSISGYGQSGPKSALPAYDGAIQADSGMMAITGFPETGPTRTGYMPVDMATALNAAFAISAALYRRLATGAGQRLDVAMMDTAIVLQTPQMASYLVTGRAPELIGNRSPTGQPTANSFATLDGHMNVLALKEPQVRALFKVIERPEALEDERFASPRARVRHYDQTYALIAEPLRRRTTAHWLAAFAAAAVPAAAIRAYEEVVRDPQLEQRRTFIRFPAPGSTPTAGETAASATTTAEDLALSGKDASAARRPDVELVRAGYETDVDGPDTPRPPPRLGEHTEEVLLEAGFSSAEIARLRDEQVI